MSERLRLKEVESINRTCDVLVVGAGFSGLLLTRKLQNLGVEVIAVEKESDQDCKPATYLVSRQIAQKYGLEEEFLNAVIGQGIINGAVTYDSQTALSLEQIGFNSGGDYGFVSLPQALIQEKIKGTIDPKRLCFQTECWEINPSQGGVEAVTSGGSYLAKIVIDATGWESRFTDGDNYVVRALFGGQYSARGFWPNKLTFINGIPENHCNWVIPIGAINSEVMAGQEMVVEKVVDWQKRAEVLFSMMCDWYQDNLGVMINQTGSVF